MIQVAEYWDILDKEKNPVGRLHRRGVRLKQGEYHLICEAWLVSRGKLLVTQRHPDKNFGGLWECTGGAVIAGENSRDAIRREIREEIGIEVKDSELVFMGSAEGPTFFIDYYEVDKDVDIASIKLQKEEVTAAKFVTYDEFMQMYRQRKLIPHMYDYMLDFDFAFLKNKR